MERWRGLDHVPTGWGRCVATIGVFDGVHRGHAEIIGRARELATQRGIPCVLVTFTPHPSEVVRPGTHPPVLTTLVRRAELVAELGVDVFCALPFSLEFSRMPPAEFVHHTLIESLHASAVVVGRNFRFGYKAQGDIETLTSLGSTFGFTAHGIPLLADVDPTGAERTLSATYVRSCVQAGDVVAAAEALGRPHRVDGIVERGDQRGRDLGYPTANLRMDRYAAVPADGVYAGRVVRLDEWGRTVGPLGGAAISVGTNPTFEGRERRVEAWIMDFEGDLYGQGIGVEFWQRLRGMVRFDSVEDLIVQMQADEAAARALYRAAGG